MTETLPPESLEALAEIALDVDERLAREDAQAAIAEAKPA